MNVLRNVVALCMALVLSCAFSLRAQSRLTVSPGSTICYGSGTTLTAGGAAKGNALLLNGTTQYVSLPLMDLSNASGLTLEAWVNPTRLEATDYSEIIRQSGNGLPNWLLSFQGYGTALSFGTSTGGSYSELTTRVSPALFDGTWHHIAASWDGNKRRIFVDGAAIDSDVVSGALNFQGTVHCIGSNAGYMEMFKGMIDEVRIWNVTRTQAQINASMHTTIPANTTGLAGAWRFDECNDTIAHDASGHGRNGRMIAAPLFVIPTTASVNPTYVWSPSAGLSSTEGPSVVASPTQTTLYTVRAQGDNCAALVDTVRVSVIVCGDTSGRLIVTPAQTDWLCIGNPVTLHATGGSKGSAVQLNGIDQFVQLPLIDIHGASGVTLEAWVYPRDVTAQMFTEIIRQSGNGLPNWLLSWQDNGQTLAFGVSHGGTYDELHVAVDPAQFNNGWHHIAGVWDGTTRTLYVDGQPIGTDNASGALDFRGTIHCIGSNGGYLEMSAGKYDEVRLWNVARTRAEIVSSMNSTVPAGTQGLAGAWRLDECGDSVAHDASGHGRDGAYIKRPIRVTPSSSPVGPTYVWSPATGLNTTFGPTVIATPTQSTVYTVQALSDTCSTLRGTATVNVIDCSDTSHGSGGLVVTPATDTLCTGHPVTLTARGGSSGSAVQLNGVDQFVHLPLIDIHGASGVTLEAWVRPRDVTSQTYTEIIRQSGNGLPNWLLSFQDGGTTLAFGVSHGGAYDELRVTVNPTTFNSGWHHIAGVWNGTTRVLYVDGQPIGTDNATGAIDFRGTIHCIGSNGGYLEMSAGQYDEVRLWNIARSQADIQAAMRNTLPAGTSGLVGAWRLDECADTIAHDASGNGHDGVYVKSPVHVTPSPSPMTPMYTWSPATGLNTTFGATVIATPSQTTTYTAHALSDSCGILTGTAAITVVTCGQLVVTPPADTICRGKNTVLTVTGGSKGNAVMLNGIDQYVDLPLINIGGAMGLTIEAWVNPSDITSQMYTEILRQSGNGLPNWLLSFQANGTILAFGTSLNGEYTEVHAMIDPAAYTNGWHHIAGVWDGFTRTIYVDGRPVANDYASGMLDFRGTVHCIGSNAGYMEMFKGKIDEVRLWNIGRSSADIQSAMLTAVPSGAPNLIGCWRLDECDDTIAHDASGNAYHGRLMNGATHEQPTSSPVDPLYVWSPPFGLSSTVGSAVTVTGDSTITYTVTGTGANCEPLSATVKITVHNCDAVGDGGTLPQQGALLVYPVPAVDHVTFEIPIRTVAPLTLCITDLLGRTVYTDRRAFVDGVYRTTLDASLLPSGVYSVEIATGGSHAQHLWLRR